MRFIHPIIILRELYVPMLFWFMNWKVPQTFEYRGNKYRYVRHPHNRTWVNERIVEIALGLDILKKNKGKRILEVGNVLSNYTHISHDVLDKYESFPGVMNEDIVEYNPHKKYDLIICISTLEHVGWDEDPREPEKIVRAIQHMKSLLSKKGMIFITTPFGYNSYLDYALENNTLPFDEVYFMHRESWKNNWKHVEKKEIRKRHYSWFVMHANTLAISSIYAGS